MTDRLALSRNRVATVLLIVLVGVYASASRDAGFSDAKGSYERT